MQMRDGGIQVCRRWEVTTAAWWTHMHVAHTPLARDTTRRSWAVLTEDVTPRKRSEPGNDRRRILHIFHKYLEGALKHLRAFLSLREKELFSTLRLRNIKSICLWTPIFQDVGE